MSCKQCNSERIMDIQGHCVDRFTATLDGKMFGPDYVPDDMGIGEGDDIEISFCLDCGQMEGEFPIHPQFFEPDEEEDEDMIKWGKDEENE